MTALHLAWPDEEAVVKDPCRAWGFSQEEENEHQAVTKHLFLEAASGSWQYT
jgi:hypothetical protein